MAAMVYAAKIIKDLGLEGDYTLVVVGSVQEEEDGLVIQGVSSLKGGRVSGCNDHRVVMAMAVAALRAGGPVEITDPHSIRKSYPSFFKEYNRLGGNAHVLETASAW